MAIRPASVASCCCCWCWWQAASLALVLIISFTLVIDASSSSPFSSLPTFQSKASHHHSHHHKSLLLQSSSTVQKQYTKPPHDIKLYDTLHVKPNATLAEIQKSWRRLSRDWHPDKVAVRKRRRRNNNNNDKMRLQKRRSDDLNTNTTNSNNNTQQEEDDEEEYAKQKLAQLTTAYEILSDDHTRLLYHKYGLIGGTDAAIQLLSGRPSATSTTSSTSSVNEGIGSVNLQTDSRGATSTSTTDEQSRLLELMGYPPQGYATTTSSWSHPRHSSHHFPNSHYSTSSNHQYSQHHNRHQYNNEARHYNEHHRQHQQRLAYLTATITERLRPIVEGTVSQDLFVNDVYQEVNTLKKSPLGAHILRCIGRAYRIEGYRVLRELHHQQNNNARVRGDNGGQSRRRRNHYHHRHRHGRHAHHHAHRSVTRRHHHEIVADKVHDRWRDVKHYASAALASGKLVLMEQRIKKLEGEHERRKHQLHEDRQRQRGEQQQHHEMEEGENGVKRIQSSSHGGEQQQAGNVFASNIGALPGDNFDIDESYNDEDVFNFNNFGDIENENIGGFSDNEQDDFSNLFDNNNNLIEGGQDNADDELEQELQHIQHQKLYSALLSAHQMEALWKITKIELDKTIREACRCILSNNCGDDVEDNDGGWYDAFCPSSDWHSPYSRDQYDQTPPPPPSSRHRKRRHHHRRHNQHRQTWPDGWVGTTGEVVSLEVGRLRAAAALILVGDICVQCSKEGTSWNK